MSSMTLKALVVLMVLASTGLFLSACNTTKATVDTFAKFTSSTSPGDWINADGVIQNHQKARLFAAVAFENGGCYAAFAVIEAEAGRAGAGSRPLARHLVDKLGAELGLRDELRPQL